MFNRRERVGRDGFQRLYLGRIATIAGLAVVLAGSLIGSVGLAGTPAGETYAANVSKPVCGAGDVTESGLQGQITLEERQAGFKGANCNLQLVSSLALPVAEQFGSMAPTARDRAGRLCGFAAGVGGTIPTIVVDMTNADHMVQTATLTSPAMMRAVEALKTNETRGLLVTTSYVFANTGNANPDERTFDVYDIGADCRYPKLLASVRLPFATANLKPGFRGFRWPDPDYVMGHEGNFAPDGMTYYVADTNHGVHHAIDLREPDNPRLLDSFMTPAYNGYRDDPNAIFAIQAAPHSLSISIDGNRGYFSMQAADDSVGVVPQTGEWYNGFMVVDTSEIQARKPGGRMRFMSQVITRDGGAHHGPIFLTIKGHPYIIDNDELGGGQMTPAGRMEACRAKLPPNGLIRIWDMRDELDPRLMTRLVLETNDPAQCTAVEPEIAATHGPEFIYDPHQCSVDNRENATVLACGYSQSGIRIFDIRNPERPRELAYYKPPAMGPNRVSQCMSIPKLDAKAGMVYGFCSGVGFVALRFRAGIWPFPESSTPADRQL